MPNPPPSPPSAFPNLGYAVVLASGLLVIQVGGGGLIGSVGLAQGREASAALNPWTLTFVNLVATALLLALVLRFTREPAAHFFRPRSFDWRLLPAVVITAVGLAIILSATTDLIMDVLRLLPGYKDPGDPFKWRVFPLGTACATILIAPLTEEYLFRGLILRGLLTHHRPATAIGLTALLFGIVHANAPQFVLGCVLGSVLGWWYVQTRSVTPCLIGHAVFNAVGCAAMLVPGLARFGFSYPGEPIVHEPWWLTLGGLVLTVAGLWWFRQLTGPLPTTATVADPPLLAESPLVEPPLLAAEPGTNQPPAS